MPASVSTAVAIRVLKIMLYAFLESSLSSSHVTHKSFFSSVLQAM
jgi:hypothetical protein